MKEEDTNTYFNYRPKRKQRKRSRMQDFLLKHPRCHCFLVGSGCATILILVGALAALGIWVLQFRKTPDAQAKISAAETVSKEKEEDSSDKWSMLQRFLCKPHCNNSAGNLKLCPIDWLLHENKCYWISSEKRTWNESRDECRAKDAKIAMLKEQADLHFIQRVTHGAQLLWIGLSVNSTTCDWLWVDNSPLNKALLPITSEAQGNSCGMLKGQKVISESCSAVTRWICETAALLI